HIKLRDQGSQLVTAPNQCSEAHAVKGFEGVADFLDLLVFVAVAISLKNSVPAALVVIAPQELGDSEFDGFLEHELSAQADAFRQWRSPCGRAEELFFEGLAG